MAEVDRPISFSFVHRSIPVLDALITVYAVAFAFILITGGVTLGILSLHEAAKPLLVLLVAVPVRVALGGRSWLADLTRMTVDWMRLKWDQWRARLPPAVADTLFAFIVVRIASLPAGFLANLILEPARERGFSLPFRYEKFAEIFVAWDSGWYWDIARRGYYFSPDAQSSIAFFPLYPMLMRIVAAPFGGGERATWVAGILISFVACGLAFVAIHRLTEKIFGSREIAQRTVLYVAVFPWSLFLTRVYAESLFLLLSVLAVSRAYDGRWARAGMWGALATLARPNGILIGLPLALLALKDRPRPGVLAARWTALLPLPAAFAGYCAYVYSLTGDPLGWLSAQTHWGYSLGHPPWQQLLALVAGLLEQGPYGFFFTSDMAPFEVLHGVPALFFLALTPAIFQRLGPAMGLYVLASLLVPLSSNTLEGLGRYVSVLFPAFMLVGSMATARGHEAIVIISLVFRTLLTVFFVTWQPIY